jgi:hypothetical protein
MYFSKAKSVSNCLVLLGMAIGLIYGNAFAQKDTNSEQTEKNYKPIKIDVT